MRNSVSSRIGRLPSDSGQVTVVVLLALGIFLLGAVGFGVDIANLWFHRQAAQTAADAACTGGAMDMLVQAEGAGSSSWINSTTDCPANSATIAPCWYAAHNGYDSSGLTAGSPSNKVTLSYPGTVAGVTTPPNPPVAVPFLQVSVTDRVKVFFAAMLSGSRTMDVGAKAVCGVLQSKAPVPIIVLNPSCPHAFQVSGSARVSIVGGQPEAFRSIRRIQLVPPPRAMAAALLARPGVVRHQTARPSTFARGNELQRQLFRHLGRPQHQLSGGFRHPEYRIMASNHSYQRPLHAYARAVAAWRTNCASRHYLHFGPGGCRKLQRRTWS